MMRSSGLASDASKPQRMDLASSGMLGLLFPPVQDQVQQAQGPVTAGPPAQSLASASLLEGWKDSALCNSSGLGSTSSISTDDASLLTCSAAQQAGLQPGMLVSSAFISSECHLGGLNASDPALQLLEDTIKSFKGQQIDEHQEAQREHEHLQQQALLQQYEQGLQQQYGQQQQLLPQAQEPQNSSQWGASATVFFAGVSPIATSEALLGVFAQFGRVMSINLFKPYKGAKTTKGCGLVTFFKPSEAAHALETLNGQFVWPGARTPMVIEWCTPERHARKPRRQAPRRTRAPQRPQQQQQLVPDLVHVPPHQTMPPGLCHPLLQQQHQQQLAAPGLSQGLPQALQEQLLTVQFPQPQAVHFPQPQATALLQQQLQALTLTPELAATLGAGTYAIMRVGP